jgi:hypothetical protein
MHSLLGQFLTYMGSGLASARTVWLAGQGKSPSAASGSATIVRVGSHRHLEVIRHGIHDAAFAGGTQRFLQHLIRRWEHSRH